MTKRLLLTLLLFVPLRLSAQTYLAGGVAVESAHDLTLLDADCRSTQPPALFGCGVGNDGRPFGARGDLRHGRVFELVLGRELGRVRVEAALASRSGFELEAQANFTGVSGSQPVAARARSLALLFSGVVDLAPESWRLRPFVTGGAGLSRNDMSAIVFAFPGIASDAVTITHGGQATGFAWTAGAGLTFVVARHLSLDLTARHTDLGRIQGDRGEALIVRPRRVVRLDLAPIEMTWRARGLSISLRWRA